MAQPLRTDIEGMIASARARGIDSVAEHIENESVNRTLQWMGVDFVQGFRFHRAEPIERLRCRLYGRSSSPG